MVKQKVIVKNPIGLALGPAGTFCEAAMLFQSSISFIFKGDEVNAKSILSILGACVKGYDEIELICDGEDENEAMEYLLSIVDEGLIEM